jgi:hypothetical protein
LRWAAPIIDPEKRTKPKSGRRTADCADYADIEGVSESVWRENRTPLIAFICDHLLHPRFNSGLVALDFGTADYADYADKGI